MRDVDGYALAYGSGLFVVEVESPVRGVGQPEAGVLGERRLPAERTEWSGRSSRSSRWRRCGRRSATGGSGLLSSGPGVGIPRVSG